MLVFLLVSAIMPTPDTNKPPAIGVNHGEIAMLTDTESANLNLPKNLKKSVMVTACFYWSRRKVASYGEWLTVSPASKKL